MDIAGSKKTALMADRRVFDNTDGLAQKARTYTVLTAGLTKATHYPNGFIKPGTILARYDSGPNEGLWAAHVPDSTAGVGLENSDGMVWDGFYIDEVDGVAPAKVAGSVLVAGTVVQIALGFCPGLLDEAGADHVVVAADLPAGAIAVPGL